MNYLSKARSLELEITIKFEEIVTIHPHIEFNKQEDFEEDWDMDDDSYLIYLPHSGETINVFLLGIKDNSLHVLSTDRMFDYLINFSDIGSVEEKAEILDRIIFKLYENRELHN